MHAEKSGFSGKKALVGAVFTGGIGLLAGTIGSKNIYLTCLKCSHRFKTNEAFLLRSDLPIDLDSRLKELLKRGKLLNAVRLYSKETGTNMSEAEKYVMRHETQHEALLHEIPACCRQASPTSHSEHRHSMEFQCIG